MNRVSPVTQVVATGIGAAIFFVLGRFIAIPTPIANTSVTLQYAALAIFAVLYGPIVGALAGLIGHFLIDVTGYGPWVSWEVASGVFGLILGFVMLRHAIHEGEFAPRTMLRFNLGVILAHAAAWLLVAPLGDILIYNEPANKTFTQGGVAFVVNSIVTCILGTLILAIYARTRTQTGSLTVEQ